MVSEPTTGVAADAGNVLGGGVPLTAFVPPHSLWLPRELARTPVPN